MTHGAASSATHLNHRPPCCATLGRQGRQSRLPCRRVDWRQSTATARDWQSLQRGCDIAPTNDRLPIDDHGWSPRQSQLLSESQVRLHLLLEPATRDTLVKCHGVWYPCLCREGCPRFYPNFRLLGEEELTQLFESSLGSGTVCRQGGRKSEWVAGANRKVVVDHRDRARMRIAELLNGRIDVCTVAGKPVVGLSAIGAAHATTTSAASRTRRFHLVELFMGDPLGICGAPSTYGEVERPAHYIDLAFVSPACAVLDASAWSKLELSS